MVDSFHTACFDILMRYIQHVKLTRKRYVTLGELKLVAKIRKVKFSTRAVHNLVNRGLTARTAFSGVHKIL